MIGMSIHDAAEAWLLEGRKWTAELTDGQLRRLLALAQNEADRRTRRTSVHRLNEEWERTRARVLWRDNFVCQYCGFDGATERGSLGVDHRVPSSRGGTHTEDNLVACCRWCNSEKGTCIYPGEWRPTKRADNPKTRRCKACDRFRPIEEFGIGVAEQAWGTCHGCLETALHRWKPPDTT